MQIVLRSEEVIHEKTDNKITAAKAQLEHEVNKIRAEIAETLTQIKESVAIVKESQAAK